MEFLKDFMSRTPFALIGTLGFISLIDDLIAFAHQFEIWIDAWRFVTRPIWGFLLGWAWDMPDLAKDYLSAGIIFGGMYVRAAFVFNLHPARLVLIDGSLFYKLPLKTASVIVLWPAVSLFMLYATYLVATETRKGQASKMSARDLAFAQSNRATCMIFWESLVWALILIAVNFAILS